MIPDFRAPDNIRFGKPEASDRDVRAAAKLANADGFVRNLPDGYDTPVGERGAKLSGGQRQRIAIARALMASPKMLMLDEPSLGLAPLLVKEIFENIQRINQEMDTTILLVEQNANVALQVSDRGYVMEVGGMVMDGPSDHLIESEDIKEFYLGKKEEGVRGRRRWKKRKTWR